MSNEFDQGNCPRCNEDIYFYDVPKIDGDSVSYDYDCPSCGYKGTEWYTIEFSHHSEREEDKNLEKI